MSETEELVSKGMNYYNQNEYEQAFACFKAAADLGDMNAHVLVGQCYYKGIGVSPNNRKAKEYYEKAANRDCPGAFRELGQMCFNGDYGFISGKGKAFWFWEQGAKLGDPDSQCHIAESYLTDEWGDGKNLRKAAYWYTAAYQNRHSDQETIDRCRRMLERLKGQFDLAKIKWDIVENHPEYLNLPRK